MKKTCLFLCVAAFSAAAQTPQSAGIVYQQAGVLSVQSSGGGPVTMAFPAMIGPDIADLAGSPFSATQQTSSLQVLGDGTRIERNETQQIYRDNVGRTRVESGPSGSGTVVIQDPVSGVTAVLDPAAKTAQKIAGPPQMKFAAPVGNTAVRTQQFAVAAGSLAMTRSIVAPPPGLPGVAVTSSATKPVTEELPAQNVNGVMATGRKTTLTIPVGEIGNDRPIQVASETWYSSDLQMMVKSSSSDPRFGDSSFELTNINRNEPDPGLFQIPADYTVSEPRTVHSRPMQPKE
jgi:hypothetical protein